LPPVQQGLLPALSTSFGSASRSAFSDFSATRFCDLMGPTTPSTGSLEFLACRLWACNRDIDEEKAIPAKQVDKRRRDRQRPNEGLRAELRPWCRRTTGCLGGQPR
jgi:hypothetical protein